MININYPVKTRKSVVLDDLTICQYNYVELRISKSNQIHLLSQHIYNL